MQGSKIAKVRLQTITIAAMVVPQIVRAVELACVQAVTLHGSQLWFDPGQVSSFNDLELLLN